MPGRVTDARDEIIELAKIQRENRYGFLNVGTDRYPRSEPVSPFIILGLLLAVQILDETEATLQS